MSELVLVAKLGRTHALAGAVVLHDLSDFNEQFKKGAKFYLDANKELEISSYDPTKSIVKFKGIEDINQAKALVNKKLYTTKERTKEQFELAEGEYFYFDIIGLNVYEDDKLLGKVVDICEVGANYLFEIATDKDLILTYEQENNPTQYSGDLPANKHKKYKLNTLAKRFYVPYVDAYIKQINEAIYTHGAFEILKQS